MDNLFVNPQMTQGSNDMYYLMYKNSVAGILSYDFISDKFSFESNKDYKEMVPFPIVLIYSDEQLKDKWDSIIRNWIEDRVIQKNRPETKDILKHLGLSHYNQWDICRKNLAISVEDFFWISKSTELKYEDVSVRYNLLNGTEALYQAPFPMVTYPNKIDYFNEMLDDFKKSKAKNTEEMYLNLKEIVKVYDLTQKYQEELKKITEDTKLTLMEYISNNLDEITDKDDIKEKMSFINKMNLFYELYEENKSNFESLFYNFIKNNRNRMAHGVDISSNADNKYILRDNINGYILNYDKKDKPVTKFEVKVIDEKYKEYIEDFKPLITMIGENDFRFVTVPIMNKFDHIIYKYEYDPKFYNSSLIEDINSLAQLIGNSAHDGKIKDKEVLKLINKFRKEIIKEYGRLFCQSDDTMAIGEE